MQRQMHLLVCARVRAVSTHAHSPHAPPDPQLTTPLPPQVIAHFTSRRVGRVTCRILDEQQVSRHRIASGQLGCVGSGHLATRQSFCTLT